MTLCLVEVRVAVKVKVLGAARGRSRALSMATGESDGLDWSSGLPVQPTGMGIPAGEGLRLGTALGVMLYLY
jgi:hypothetical protein